MLIRSRSLVVQTLCAALLFPAIASAGASRPAGAPTGEIVAEVHLWVGTAATLVALGRSYPAAPGTALLRNDELVVPPGEVLVVQLRNGYLVRLDDDLRLPVGKIVLLDAPHTSESIGKQLDRLLTKEEQGRAERIAGVQARLAGAEGGSASGGGGSGNARSGGGQLSRGPSGESATGAPPAPPTPPRPSPPLGAPTQNSEPTAAVVRPPDDSPVAKDARAGAEDPARGRSEATARSRQREPAPAAIEAKPRPAPVPAERRELPLPNQAKLRTCLARELRHLPVAISVAPLRLRIEGGKIARVGLGGGLSLPACARPLLLGAPLEGQEHVWLERALPLR